MVERTYVVPLRKAWLKTPRWRRSKKAVAALRAYILKHTKSKEVKIGKWLNEEVWKKRGKNPPGKVLVKVEFDKDVANVELAELSPKAKRIEDTKAKKEAEKKKEEKAKEAAKKKEEQAKKKEKEDKKAKKEEDKKKAEDYKKKKKEDKEEIEDIKKKESKKKARITKEQEMSMHKR